MTDTKTKNIYQKLAIVKTKIEKFSKTEENKFANFRYTHLSDILEKINLACEEVGLLFNIGEYSINLEKTLQLDIGIIYSVKAELVNTDKPEEIIAYLFDTPKDEAGSGTKMKQIQSVGSTITYGTRYIYGVVFSIQFESDADSEEARRESGNKKITKKTDFGTPKGDFNRDEIIQFGAHAKGKKKPKKWSEVSDKYLQTLLDGVKGGYVKFIEAEIKFRKDLKDETAESGGEKTLTKEEVEKTNEDLRKKKEKEKKAKIKQAKIDKAKKLQEVAEKALKEAEREDEEDEPDKENTGSDNPSEEESEVSIDDRKDVLKKIEGLVRKGHFSSKGKVAWIETAESENDPIKFHIFYWKVSTAEIVCEASDANLINEDTKKAYFKIIKNTKTKKDDLEPIMNDMKELLKNKK